MDDHLRQALLPDIAELTPQQIKHWIEGKGWMIHPTAHPKTLYAWSMPKPQRNLRPVAQVVSLPTSTDDHWFLDSAALLIGAVAVYHEVSLLTALDELGVRGRASQV